MELKYQESKCQSYGRTFSVLRFANSFKECVNASADKPGLQLRDAFRDFFFFTEKKRIISNIIRAFAYDAIFFLNIITMIIYYRGIYIHIYNA